jgi:hypothetical protein
MRKNILTLCILSLIALGACTKSANDNSDEVQSSASVSSRESLRLPSIECPPGYHPHLSYSFDEFHFHRPKKGCKSGFWFCTIGGSWEVSCVSDHYRLPASINGTTAYVWAQELKNGQLEIHFPLALKNTEGYTKEDLATFNVDEEYEIYEGITLKTGDYPVQETDVDLVAIVDIL